MKFRCLMVAAAIALPLFAQAADTDGFYIDGALGSASNRYAMPNSRAATLDLGYHWSWIGIDIGYVDFSKRSASYLVMNPTDVSGPPITNAYGTRESGVTLDASGRWKIGEHLYYSARAGLYS